MTIELPLSRSRDCPLCSAARFSVVAEHPPWRLAQCHDCGLAYLPETPTDASIDVNFEWSESFARARFERWARNPLARVWTAAVALLKPDRISRALRRIQRYAPPGRLLDVGCGDGRLLMAARQVGYDAVGVELSPKIAARARRRVGESRVICGRLGDAQLMENAFDVIVTVSYLEHEPAPLEALRHMYRVLRPGGVCLHKTPNYATRLRWVLGPRWSGYRWPEHVQYFTPETLGRLVTAAGFAAIDVRANPWSDNFWLATCKPRSRHVPGGLPS